MYNVNMQCIRTFFYVCSFILALYSHSVVALEISPLSIELKTDAKPSYQQIIVRNTSNRTVPVEVSLNRIIFNPNAEKPYFTLSEDDGMDDLLVFPPALILEPGATQSVRVQWSSDTLLSESKSYFVRFSQPQLFQNLDAEATPSGVKVFIHFNAVVHVSSTKLTPNLSIISDSIKVSADSKHLEIGIVNYGSSYHFLDQKNILKLSADKTARVLLNASQFEQLGQVFLPPNTVRILSLPLSEAWEKGDSLRFEAPKRD